MYISCKHSIGGLSLRFKTRADVSSLGFGRVGLKLCNIGTGYGGSAGGGMLYHNFMWIVKKWYYYVWKLRYEKAPCGFAGV